MTEGFRRFKPGVSPRAHLACAAGLWTGIGGFLLVRGIILLKNDGAVWLIVAGILFGSLKSILILDRSARKGIERIGKFADNTCIGAVYAWKTWLLVLGMMATGILVRTLGLPPSLVGTVCVAVGWALIFSSRYGWRSWTTWNKTQ
jgi:hypothetical protein